MLQFIQTLVLWQQSDLFRPRSLILVKCSLPSFLAKKCSLPSFQLRNVVLFQLSNFIVLACIEMEQFGWVLLSEMAYILEHCGTVELISLDSLMILILVKLAV